MLHLMDASRLPLTVLPLSLLLLLMTNHRHSQQATPSKVDIVIFGATGFTGKLVAEHFAAQYAPDSGSISWALAGRSYSRLQAVRDGLGCCSAVPLIVADALDADSVAAMVRRARVVLSVVGPYVQYGSLLVEACASTGTHYVDIDGEVIWMWQMARRHGATAAASGATLIHACAFDSLPSDLGTHLLAEAAERRYGRTVHALHGRQLFNVGFYSGGTLATLRAMEEVIASDPILAAVALDMHSLEQPLAKLTPERARLILQRSTANRSSLDDVFTDTVTGALAKHTALANINIHVVLRSAALLGRVNMSYDEYGIVNASDALVARHGLLAFRDARRAELAATARANPVAFQAQGVLLPGDGPTRSQRAAGYWAYLFQSDELPSIGVTVSGDSDPGYSNTAKMVAECAACLATSGCASAEATGFQTPASALGLNLMPRLEARAGMQFRVTG